MTSTLVARLYDQLQTIPIIDCHTHLNGPALSARGLHDVLLYHMVVSDLYSAGCPSGHRVEEGEEATRIQEALPYVPFIRNTSCYYGVRIILRDLYGIEEEVNEANWEQIDEMIRMKHRDPAWGREILQRAGIVRAMTEWARRGSGEGDDCLEYSFEETTFCRVSDRQPLDMPLRELERVSGQSVRDLHDVHAAMRAFTAQIPWGRVRSYTNHLSTDITYRLVSDEEMAVALTRRDTAELTLEDRDTYSNYLLEMLLSELERHGDEIVFQFSFGAEPLPYETGSKLKQDTIFQVAKIIERHPRLRFNVLLSSAHASQALCTVARECPNLSFAGYWWHNFFPSVIRHVMDERLDMVALNKQIGFFSDAYCAEWSYAKAIIVRQELAWVLAQRIERGQYSEQDAVDIARHLLIETPKWLLRLED